MRSLRRRHESFRASLTRRARAALDSMKLRARAVRDFTAPILTITHNMKFQSTAEHDGNELYWYDATQGLAAKATKVSRDWEFEIYDARTGYTVSMPSKTAFMLMRFCQEWLEHPDINHDENEEHDAPPPDWGNN